MDDIVMVPVPRRHLATVYRVIAEGEAQTQPGEQPAPQPPAPVAAPSVANGASGNGDWSPNEIARLYRESPPVMRKFLDHLADPDHADQVLTGPELATVIYGEEDDRRRRKLPGALGAFGRRVKNRYSKRTWPFKASWNYERNIMEYKMDPWTAEQIRKAQGER